MPSGRPVSDVLVALQNDPTDQEAWADLYRRLWPYVLTLSLRSLGSGVDINDAEDLAQEVFVRLARALHDGKLQLPHTEATFRTLLAVMTRNRASDFIRHARRKSRDSRRGQSLATDVPAPDPPPEAVPVEHDLFHELLSRLDPLQQQILWLLVEGHTQNEISERLGISVRTLQRHLHVVRTMYAAVRKQEEIS
jgi:RNA polymerase sigma factor (sigma-70 family)